MIEIEKSFLVKQIPGNLCQYKAYQMQQGYISSVRPSLRIRKKGDKYELTKKLRLKEDDYSTCEELNIPLTEAEFNKLWPLIEKSLEKTRYIIPLENGLQGELDIFHGNLEGLAMVEVEFKSKEQMEKFRAPEWFGKDVTQNEFSANAALAGKTYLEVKDKLCDN